MTKKPLTPTMSSRFILSSLLQQLEDLCSTWNSATYGTSQSEYAHLKCAKKLRAIINAHTLFASYLPDGDDL